nr:uncharacterized protein LOC112751586 isoform X4 [Arachis hypogaea]
MFLVFIFILFLGFFFVGVVTVVVAEALGILWIIEGLQRKIMKDKDKISAPISLDTSSQNDPINHLTLPSKKRAKRYPIKVENNKSVVYHGSKLLYIYLETSWEKEAWCKALRMASRDQSEKLKWSSQLYEECHRYLASLNIEYHPFIMRPSAGSSFDGLEKSIVEIETKLEVGEPPNDKGTECSSNAGGAPSDLLEDLSNGDGVNDSQEPKVDVNGNTDVSKVSRSTSSSFYGSKWKSMLNSLAKHVSQV